MDFYRILGVSIDATPYEIEAKYQALLEMYGPVFRPETNEYKSDHIKEIHDAYVVLSDPIRRGEYDQSHGFTGSEHAEQQCNTTASDNTPGTYILKCKKCKCDVVNLRVKCEKCKSNFTHVKAKYPGFIPYYSCPYCKHESIAARIPYECQNCTSENLEWAHEDSGSWHQPELGSKGASDDSFVWITGKFDGYFEGVENDDEKYSRGYGSKTYSLNLKEGVLTDVKVVKSPHKSLFEDEGRPLRQESVKARVLDSESGSYVSVVLYDFRLHRFRELASEEYADKKSVKGRVVGQCYAYVGRRDSISSSAIDSPITPPKQSPSGLDNGSGKPGDMLPEKEPGNSINTSPGGTSSSGTDVCFICTHLFAFLAAVLQWLICSFQTGLATYLLTRLFCWISDWLVSKGWYLKSEFRQKLLFWTLASVSAINLVTIVYFYKAYGCGTLPWWLTIPALLSLAVGATLIACHRKFILLGMVYLAIASWCFGKNGQCYLANTGLINGVVSYHAPQTDLDTKLATSIAAEGNEKTNISIQQALNNPELLSDCKNSIYFPSAISFETDRYEILPSGEFNLYKISKVLEASPAKTFVVTGHSDSRGDEKPNGYANNVELSEKRAAAVAAWFVEHAGFSPDRFEIQGAGSKFPLTDNPKLFSTNRRVEIGAKCEVKE